MSSSWDKLAEEARALALRPDPDSLEPPKIAVLMEPTRPEERMAMGSFCTDWAQDTILRSWISCTAIYREFSTAVVVFQCCRDPGLGAGFPPSIRSAFSPIIPALRLKPMLRIDTSPNLIRSPFLDMFSFRITLIFFSQTCYSACAR